MAIMERSRPGSVAGHGIGRLWPRPAVIERWAWLLGAAIPAGLFAVGLPAQYSRFVALRGPEPYDGARGVVRRNLLRDGWTPHSYATVALSLDLALATGFVLLAVLLFRRRQDRWSLGLAAALVAFGCTFSLVPQALASSIAEPAVTALVAVVDDVALVGLVAVLLLFPDGRLTGRWPGALLVAYAGWETLRQLPALASPLGSVASPVAAVVVVTVGWTQLRRYRCGDRRQRQQLRWATAGLATGAAGFLVFGYLLPVLTPGWVQPGSTADLLVTAGVFASLLAVPTGITVAMLWSRLWDLEVALSRGIVYGLLSLTVIGVYGAAVAVVAAVDSGARLPLTILVTLGVGVALHPARLWLQRQVNGVMYGDRDDPHDALARLGRRLSASAPPAEVLQGAAETIGSSLRLPYVALLVSAPVGPLFAEWGEAESGRPADAITLPLTSHGDIVGELVAHPRHGDGWHPRDRQLLAEYALRCAPTAAAARLAAELHQAMVQAVSVREEERLRVRNDLHDGIGPELAGITLRLGALRRMLPPDSELLPLLDGARADMSELSVHIRELVRGLRPPALDDRGLAAAVGELASRIQRPDLTVHVRVQPTCRLPTAVETAVYRIVQEALTNVAKHSAATRCEVDLYLDGERMVVAVLDDGRGLPSGHLSGVGTASMRQRATELGGELTVRTRPEGGTAVRASLPVHTGVRAETE